MCSMLDNTITLFVNPITWPHAYRIPNTDIGSQEAYVTVGNQYLTDQNWPIISHPFFSLIDQNVVESREEVRLSIVHEFGHSFGGLADEYLSIPEIFPGLFAVGTPNCDDNYFGIACQKWSDINNLDCRQICTFNNWYRPFDDTLMYDIFPETTFGQVNINELTKDILNASTIEETYNINNTKSYKLDLNYSNGVIFSSDVSLINGLPPGKMDQNFGDFKLEILSDLNAILYDLNFFFPLFVNYGPSHDWFDENGTQIYVPDFNQFLIKTDVNYYIVLPFFSNGHLIKIYDNNSSQLIRLIDISQFVIKPQFTIGYGGNKLIGADFNVSFTLISQPIGKLVGNDYNLLLGTNFN